MLFWKHSALILTGIICFLFGAIVSEFVQSLLPVAFHCAAIFFNFNLKSTVQRVSNWRHSGALLKFAAILFPLTVLIIRKANLIGSSVGLWSAFYLERYYRYRREVGF